MPEDQMMSMDQGAAAAGEMESQEPKKSDGSLFLSPDMLPEGFKAEPGSYVTFEVKGTDGDGDIEVEYCETKPPDHSENGEDYHENYFNDMKKEMQARNGDGGGY